MCLFAFLISRNDLFKFNSRLKKKKKTKTKIVVFFLLYGHWLMFPIIRWREKQTAAAAAPTKGNFLLRLTVSDIIIITTAKKQTIGQTTTMKKFNVKTRVNLTVTSASPVNTCVFYLSASCSGHCCSLPARTADRDVVRLTSLRRNVLCFSFHATTNK